MYMTEDDIRNRLQMIVSELQNCVQQIAAVEGQVKELETTLKLLSNQDPELSIYRQSGPLLLEVSDRDSLTDDLRKSVETLSEHSGRLSQQESSLREQYEDIVKQFEG